MMADRVKWCCHLWTCRAVKGVRLCLDDSCATRARLGAVSLHPAQPAPRSDPDIAGSRRGDLVRRHCQHDGRSLSRRSNLRQKHGQLRGHPRLRMSCHPAVLADHLECQQRSCQSHRPSGHLPLFPSIRSAFGRPCPEPSASADARNGIGNLLTHPERDGAGSGASRLRHGIRRAGSILWSRCPPLRDPALCARFLYLCRTAVSGGEPLAQGPKVGRSLKHPPRLISRGSRIPYENMHWPRQRE